MMATKKIVCKGFVITWRVLHRSHLPSHLNLRHRLWMTPYQVFSSLILSSMSWNQQNPFGLFGYYVTHKTWRRFSDLVPLILKFSDYLAKFVTETRIGVKNCYFNLYVISKWPPNLGVLLSLDQRVTCLNI